MTTGEDMGSTSEDEGELTNINQDLQVIIPGNLANSIMMFPSALAL